VETTAVERAAVKNSDCLVPLPPFVRFLAVLSHLHCNFLRPFA
jgi:hypothetical protein